MDFFEILRWPFAIVIGMSITLAIINTILRRISVCDNCGKRGVRQIEMTPGVYGLECVHCGVLQVLDKETGATLVSSNGRQMGYRRKEDE